MLCSRRTLANGKQLISVGIAGKPDEWALGERLIKSKHLSGFSDSTSRRNMNNSSNYSNYPDYLSALSNNSQYYEEQPRASTELYADLNLNHQHLNASGLSEQLSESLIDFNHNYDFTEQSNLNALPVNYYPENYAENYGDLYNNSGSGSFSGSSSLFNQSSGRNSFNLNGKHSQQINRTSRRLFHRNSIICSSMNDKNTPNGENFATVQRPIDQIEELIANRTLFQADLSAASTTASPSIYSGSNSERNMINANGSSYDEQENNSLYNNSTSLSPNSPHSLFKRSSVISSSNETTVLPKLMPKFENGRFQNPYDGWRERTVLGTLKFFLTPSKIGLPSKKELDITLPGKRSLSDFLKRYFSRIAFQS